MLLPFLILCMVMLLVAGCIDSNNAGNTSSTQVPQAESALVTITPGQTTEATPAIASVTTVPTLSPVCSNLITASGADQAFLNFVDDNRIVTRISSLTGDNCNKLQADPLNQQVKTSVSPQTYGLAQGRSYLLSATAYCQNPDASASDNTKSDLAKFEDKRNQYAELLYSCHSEISKNASGVVGGEKLELNCVQGPQTFSGNGNSVKKFRVTDGDYKFSTTYSGSGNFTVIITNIYGKTVSEPFNTNGPYSGSVTVNFPAGDYYMSITASAPYLIRMT